MTITSIDFETANHSDASICSAGVAVFVDNDLVETRHWLVRPPKGHGWFREDFIEIHGITHEDVHDAPEFSTVAKELLPFLDRADYVVAHNAAFDRRKLIGTLSHYGITCPDFSWKCTCQAARRAWPHLSNHKLNTVAAHIGHTFKHHDAFEDAVAAGRVICAIVKESGETGLLSEKFTCR